MPWRVIALGDQVWHVDALAERPANAEAWQLVLSFRAAAGRAGARRHRAVGRAPAQGGAGEWAYPGGDGGAGRAGAAPAGGGRGRVAAGCIDQAADRSAVRLRPPL